MFKTFFFLLGFTFPKPSPRKNGKSKNTDLDSDEYNQIRPEPKNRHGGFLTTKEGKCGSGELLNCGIVEPEIVNQKIMCDQGIPMQMCRYQLPAGAVEIIGGKKVSKKCYEKPSERRDLSRRDCIWVEK